MIQKVIWITGASTGIGKEIAMEFSRAGHIVVVTARRKSRLVKIVSEIKFADREASAFVCNVISERSVQITAKRIREKYGSIDVLVSNLFWKQKLLIMITLLIQTSGVLFFA